MVNFIIVTHGEFGAYIVEAAEDIVGKQPEGVYVISLSSRFSISESRKLISKTIEAAKTKDGLILATDIPGGTPSNLILPIVKDMQDVFVISGLNLYMLVSAFNRRKNSSVEEVAQRMLLDGQKSIQDMKAALRAQYNVNTTHSH